MLIDEDMVGCVLETANNKIVVVDEFSLRDEFDPLY
jgi:hypothetical protein